MSFSGRVVAYRVAVEGASLHLEATAALLLLSVGGDRVIGTGTEGADRRRTEGALCEKAESHVVVLRSEGEVLVQWPTTSER